ncbi:MAG TPA: hypothetical protein VG456_12550 [Candidatus Sulfopaludibacter sp.]|jgi:hypothetical protein|nr:hypothetical protein [Candidatus Sulfopaludibacter sp.]
MFYRIVMRSNCLRTPGKAGNTVATGKIVWTAKIGRDFQMTEGQGAKRERLQSAMQVLRNDTFIEGNR